MQEASDGFEVLVAVVDAGSISAASRALDLPRETLSRRLGRLESRLGVRLLHRGSRRLVLTRAGEVLVARARPVVEAAREAVEAVRQLDEVPRGVLRMSVPPGAGASLMAGIVLDFQRQWPEVRVEVLATSRHVDLVGEGVDVALRAGVVKDPNLVARRLFASDVLAVAAPAYVAQRGLPQTLSGLAEHACLLAMDGDLRPVRRWPTRNGEPVPVTGTLTTNDMGLLLAAAVSGDGIALLPRVFAASSLADGTLVPVLPGVLGGDTFLGLVFVERAYLPPKVRLFVDHVVAWFEREGVAFQRALGEGPPVST